MTQVRELLGRDFYLPGATHFVAPPRPYWPWRPATRVRDNRRTNPAPQGRPYPPIRNTWGQGLVTGESLGRWQRDGRDITGLDNGKHTPHAAMTKESPE